MREPNNIRLPRVAVKYQEFLAENVQRSKVIIAQRMKDYESLKDRLTRDNTLGYLGKLTELLFRGATAEQVTDAYERVLALRKANVRVEINSVETIGELRREIARTETEARVKQVVAKLPPTQKRWFTGLNMTEEDTIVLSKMALIDTAPFMRMVSQYRNKDTLLTMAQRFIETANNPADATYFRGLAKGGLRIVHDDGRTIVFHTATARDLVKVAGDAFWCIKREGSFSSYTDGGNMQFVLIDLDRNRWDKLFKIGFTVSPSGAITNAHDMMNTGCVPYVQDLLAVRGIDKSSLIGGETEAAPDPAKAHILKLVAWVKNHGVTPEQADEWIEKLGRREDSGGSLSESIWESLKDVYKWEEFLARLIKSSARGAYITDDRVKELIRPMGIPKRNRSDLLRLLQRERVTLPNPSEIHMGSLFDVANGTPNTRLLPYINIVEDDIFYDSDLSICVDWIVGILDSREALRLRPDLADQVLRFINLSPDSNRGERVAPGSRRAIMLAAWDFAVKGKSPGHDRISKLFADCVDEDGDPALSDYEELAIICLLRVRHPFSEEVVLDRLYTYERFNGFDLLDFGKGVTLSKISNFHHEKLFRKLLREGVQVTVEASAADVMKRLKSRAAWSEDGDRYESKTKVPLPAWLDMPGMRHLVARKGEGGFEWVPGTKFPLVLKSQGKFKVVIKKKGGKS